MQNALVFAPRLKHLPSAGSVGGGGGGEFRYQISEQIPTLPPFLQAPKFRESIPRLGDSKQRGDRLQQQSQGHSNPARAALSADPSRLRGLRIKNENFQELVLVLIFVLLWLFFFCFFSKA